MENLTAYTNLIDEVVVIDDYTVEFTLLEAQAGHDSPLGADTARARLVQDEPTGRVNVARRSSSF